MYRICPRLAYVHPGLFLGKINLSVNRKRNTKHKRKLGDITKFSNNRHMIFCGELSGACCMKCIRRSTKWNADVDYDFRRKERKEVFEFYQNLRFDIDKNGTKWVVDCSQESVTGGGKTWEEALSDFKDSVENHLECLVESTQFKRAN